MYETDTGLGIVNALMQSAAARSRPRVGLVHPLAHRSWYDVGQEPPQHGGVAITSPGTVLAGLQSINNDYDALNRDISSSTSVTAAFRTAWKVDYDSWKMWDRDHNGWWDSLWGDTLNAAQVYLRKLMAWRSAFQGVGGVPSSPPPTPPTEGNLPGMDSTLTKVAIIAGIVVGGLALLELLPLIAKK